MQTALIGLGAIGSIMATHLHDRLGSRLRVLVDAERLQRYAKDPLTFNGRAYAFNYAIPQASSAKADLILIATKASGYQAALDAIAPLVGSGTAILPLLNGISSEALAAQRYGWGPVLHAFVVGHTSMRQGRQVRHDGVMELVFGQADNTVVSPRVLALRQLFESAGIQCRVPQDMRWAQWCKWAINVGFNQASALLGQPYAAFQRPGPERALLFGLMQEALSVAHAEGLADTGRMLAEAESLLASLPPQARSSMLQDVDAGFATEVKLFAGEVCRLGRKHGLATPENDKALARL